MRGCSSGITSPCVGSAACRRTAVQKGLAALCRLPAVMVVSLAGSGVMFYLAAAVSDFYIPASEMSEHKIQSSEGALQVRCTWARLLPLPHCPVMDVAAEDWQ